MVKKSLQGWYNSGDISSSQKETINKFGVDDCEHALWDLKKIWYFNEILIRNGYKLENHFDNDPVHHMIFFSAKWNNNLILVVIGKGGELRVSLIVYEMPSQKMREVFEVFCVDYTYRYVEGAKSRAREIMEKLRNEENPIRYVIFKNLEVRYYDDYNSISFPASYGDVCSGKKIIKIELPFSSAKSNPDAYIKPLDIVKIFARNYSSSGYAPYMVHACIYLGGKKIAHALQYDEWGNRNEIRMENWDDFLNILRKADKMIRFHPVVPFKVKGKIIEHIAKCIGDKGGYFEKKEKFNICNIRNEDREIIRKANNCECFVNRCVLGLDFSELADRKEGSASLEINTLQKLDETNSDLDRLSCSNNKVEDVKRHTNVYHPQGINMESYIEVQPKSSIFKDMIREYLNRQ